MRRYTKMELKNKIESEIALTEMGEFTYSNKLPSKTESITVGEVHMPTLNLNS